MLTMARSGAGSPRYYPLFLNLTGRRCVVVGGGRVARRKVLKLLEADARVTVISPSPDREITRLWKEKRIVLRRRRFRRGDLRGSVLAIGATNERNVNELVSEEARKRSILVNVVDDPVLSDFIVPSVVRRGDLLIAISTLGESPAFSREVRIELERLYGVEFGRFLQLVGTVRRRLKGLIPSEKGRKVMMRTLVREGMEVLRRGKKVRDIRKSYLKKLGALEDS